MRAPSMPTESAGTMFWEQHCLRKWTQLVGPSSIGHEQCVGAAGAFPQGGIRFTTFMPARRRCRNCARAKRILDPGYVVTAFTILERLWTRADLCTEEIVARHFHEMVEERSRTQEYAP